MEKKIVPPFFMAGCASARPILKAKRLGNTALKKHSRAIGETKFDLTSLRIKLMTSHTDDNVLDHYANAQYS